MATKRMMRGSYSEDVDDVDVIRREKKRQHTMSSEDDFNVRLPHTTTHSDNNNRNSPLPLYRLQYFVKKCQLPSSNTTFRLVGSYIPETEFVKNVAVVTLVDKNPNSRRIEKVFKTYSGYSSVDAVVVRLIHEKNTPCTRDCLHNTTAISKGCSKYEQYLLLKGSMKSGIQFHTKKPCVLSTVTTEKSDTFHEISSIFPSVKHIVGVKFSSSANTDLKLTNADIGDNLIGLENSQDITRLGLLKTVFQIRPFWTNFFDVNTTTTKGKSRTSLPVQIRNVKGWRFTNAICLLLLIYMFLFDWIRANLIPSLSFWGVPFGGWRAKVFQHVDNKVVFQKVVGKSILKSHYAWNYASNYYTVLKKGSYYKKTRQSSFTSLKKYIFSMKTSLFTTVYIIAYMLFFFLQMRGILESVSHIYSETYWVWKTLVIVRSFLGCSILGTCFFFLFRKYFCILIMRQNKQEEVTEEEEGGGEGENKGNIDDGQIDKEEENSANSSIARNQSDFLFVICALFFPPMTLFSLLCLFMFKIYQFCAYLYKLTDSYTSKQ